MQGVEFKKGETGSLCFAVREISEDLKIEIRSRLSEICNGAAKASRNTTLYSYQRTLSAFFQKFDTKSSDTQKGMIGELLTHVLLLHYESDFRSASTFFNLEEDSIKKGFDLVLHHDTTGQIWFVEVKAGDCGGKTSIQKLGDLLSLAKNGLKTALNSKRFTLWQNAVHGATVVIQDRSLKEQIENLLEGYNEKALEGESTSTDYNAALVAVSYLGNQEFATPEEFDRRHNAQKEMNEFHDLISIAFQKDTFQSVVEFLRGEIKDV